MLMKMDYNNFVRLVDETLGDQDGLNAYYIGVGFNLLTAYLRRLAEIAIERNDAEIHALCKDLEILREKEREEQK